ncbi:uncharacterized protein LOC116604647 [Nematostella vectensis]|uniref:uncharacterized protein LOC116604647 n=1 Tax=Nematostella vectensis TaxID=45351 RepID=UPI002077119E|nr:uncharacterized protein LOC116604647 [Nematostella vectensis]
MQLYILVVLASIITLAGAGAGWMNRLEEMGQLAYYANTELSMSGRALTIQSINQMKRGEKEDSLMSLKRAIIGLAVVDIGGLVFTSPAAEYIATSIAKRPELALVNKAISDYKHILKNGLATEVADADALIKQVRRLKDEAIDRFNDVAKSLQNSNTPFANEMVSNLKTVAKLRRITDVLGVIGSIFDVVSISLDSADLVEAIQEGNEDQIIISSLGIASSVVGISSFVIAATTSLTVLGPIGALASALLGIAGTIYDIYSSYPSCNMQKMIRHLEALSDECRSEVKSSASLALKAGNLNGTIYESNPSCMIFVNGIEPEKPLKFKPGDEYKVEGETFVVAGENRVLNNDVFSNLYWTVSGHTNVGYDFYGKFIKGHGVTVFLDTKLINGSSDSVSLGLRGANIQTYSPGYENQYAHDQVSIEDYTFLQLGERIEVRTGNGMDVISLNGPIGRFTAEFSDVLYVDAGSNYGSPNTLSFGGIPKTHAHIKGAYFNAIDGKIGFFHGHNKELHKFGTAKAIRMVQGSPFADTIVMDGEGFRVEQQNGKNIYQLNLGNMRYARTNINQTILDVSGNAPKIRVETDGSLTKENFSFLQKTNKTVQNLPDGTQEERVRDKSVLTISRRLDDYSWEAVRHIDMKCKCDLTETIVELYENGKETTHFDLFHMKKVQVSGEQYNFQFLGDLGGTPRNDLVRISRPDLYYGKHTTIIDLADGLQDAVVITVNLMEVAQLFDGTRTLRLESGNGHDYVLQIRSTKPTDDYKYDVTLKGVEYVMSESLVTIANIRELPAFSYDLVAPFKEAENIP